MSNDSFACEIVEINEVLAHPQADRLEIVNLFDGLPVVTAKGSYKVGDRAVYIPVDAVVPVSRPEFSFLGRGRETERIKARRLRGFYSEGLLVPVPEKLRDAPTGFDCKEELGVVKYEEPVSLTLMGLTAKDPGFMPTFSLHPYQRRKKLLREGEEVVVTEKIHGTNARFGFRNDEFFAGSRNIIRANTENCLYWTTARAHGIEEKMREHGLDGITIYGEIFGWVQDLKYGATPGTYYFRVFASYAANLGQARWLNHDEVLELCEKLDLPHVPVLYRGPYVPETVEPLRTGKTVVSGDHIREGIVIVPAKEREDIRYGRVALKLVSEEYKLRKGGTEHN